MAQSRALQERGDPSRNRSSPQASPNREDPTPIKLPERSGDSSTRPQTTVRTMPLSLYLIAPALALWLMLPLLMRPAFRNAGLPPTAAATALLAIVLCASLILSGDPVVVGPLASDETDRSLREVHSVVSRQIYLLDLSFIGLAIAGTAILAKGMMQGDTGGVGPGLRRFIAGLGAFFFHVGVGVSALLAFGPLSAMPRRFMDEAGLFFGQQQAGFLAGGLLLAGAGLVLLVFTLTLIGRILRS